MGNRITYVDFAKGLAMLLVLIGHINTYPFFKQMIYSFHMPLFFILSGFFMKPSDEIMVNVKKSIRSLLIPYFVTGIFIVAMNFFLYNENLMTNVLSLLFMGGHKCGFEIEFMGPIWFLYVMFVAKFYYDLLKKISFVNKDVALFVGAIAAIAIKMVLGTILPFGIQQSLIAALFLRAGFLIHNYQILEKISAIFKSKYWMACVFIVPLFAFSPKMSIAFRKISFSNGVFSLLSCVVLSIAFIYICKIVSEKTEKIHLLNNVFKYFCFCGKYSLVILCLHTVENEHHLMRMDHSLFILEIVVRFALLSFVTLFFTKIKFTRALFNLK